MLEMHPSATTTTPFSVKDILKLEHHHDFETELLMTDQVVPMHYQHVHGASRSIYDCGPEPCVSGMKLSAAAAAAAAAAAEQQEEEEEEMNEHGEEDAHRNTHSV